MSAGVTKDSAVRTSAGPTPRQGGPSKQRQRVGISRLVILVGIAISLLALLLPPSSPDLDLLLDSLDDDRTALILTAHPDDEVMFFTPTVLALVQAGWSVSALCLSTGNGDGLGDVRTKELYNSYERLGVPAAQVTVLDDLRLQDGMDNHWTSSYVSQILDDHLAHSPASVIITFDPIGITYHPNHIALAHGCSFGPRRSPGQCYALQSPSLLFKFTGALCTILHNTSQRWTDTGVKDVQEHVVKRKLTVVNGLGEWLTGARAMAEHKSQLVWFRYLYFVASRLVWHNQLEELLEHG